MILCPVKKSVWGAINSLDDLKRHIGKSGQFFGQDLSGPACEFNTSYPCDKTLYEYMGWGLHKGLDIPCASMTEVYASHDGKVTRVSDDPTQGLGVVIWDSVQGIESVYWHLQSHSVGISDIIKVGQLIGLSDNTGFSKGNHLHFQVNLTNESGKSLNAIDPLPLISFNEDMTEHEVASLQALEGYSDPEGVAYWTGKPLSEYLKARLSDKLKDITKLVNE